MPVPTPRLSCPSCGHPYSRITHVEYSPDPGDTIEIWRRRECLACHVRYTTRGQERIVSTAPVAPSLRFTLEIIPPST